MENSTATQNTTTEVEPLKSGGDHLESGRASSQQDLKKNCTEGLGFGKLSHWRTAIFFFSLFLCLTIVFAFSFVIPCPVRPQYVPTWNRTFPTAATYDFLAFQDANKDKVMDVLFVIAGPEGSHNYTDTVEGGPPRTLVYVMAVAGTDGETLWAQALEPEFHWAQCGLGGEKYAGWDCLLFHSDQLTALDKYTGNVVWQRPHPAGPSSTLPVLSLPDLDGDGVKDVGLVRSGAMQTQMMILSGKTGEQLGSEVTVDQTGTARHLQHITEEGACYVLFQKGTGLYGLALSKMAAKAKAGMELGLKMEKMWESKANSTFDLVPVYKSSSLKYVQSTGKPRDPSKLLLVSGEEVVMMDGDDLRQLWSFNTTGVSREPSFGHFEKDNALDVVIEEDVGNNTKRVLILSGGSGAVLWQVNMLPIPNSPTPASVMTLTSVSVFMLWGMVPGQGNSSASLGAERKSYMLHPQHAEVLLENTNVPNHIFTFKATLLERGRHACYILLTDAGANGGVMLRKRKLKDDVVDSAVRRVGAVITEDDDDIKEAFNRLRFSDD